MNQNGKVLCAGSCGELINPITAAWTSVKGWEQRREQGGTNHVALRQSTGQVMCEHCMRKAQAGLATTQMGLDAG